MRKLIYITGTSHGTIMESHGRAMIKNDRQLTTQNSEHLLGLLVAGVTDYAIFTMDPDGLITSWNEGAQRIKGYSSDEILGQHFSIFYPPEEVAGRKPEEGLECALRGGRFEERAWRKRKDGTQFWADAIITPIRDDDGKLQGFGKITRDLSAWKRHEEERTELERRLHERNKQLEQVNEDLALARDRALEASRLKSKFVANISHEIRTPMSGVLGMTELLMGYDLDSETLQLVGYIHKSAKSLLDVLNDLLDFSKLEAGKMKINRVRLNVQSIVDAVQEHFGPLANSRGIKLTFEVEPGLPEMFGDANRIRQILLNLVSNGIKFTHKGSVDIKIYATERKEDTLVLHFSVQDSGIGISESAGASLFNPFEQADGSTTRRYGGTGLGLSICRSLVRLMLGEMGFSSVENQGSTFWFWIPLETA